MEEKVLMTKHGFDAIQEELKELRVNERPAIINAIAEARLQGDLSENAEYHSARERQSFIEGRIAELEDVTSRAQVIDVASLSGDKVVFGATVVIMDEETEAKTTYKIVGKYEADLKKSLISIQSPIARAMIGKQVGDEIEVNAPGGSKNYVIVSISFEE